MSLVMSFLLTWLAKLKKAQKGDNEKCLQLSVKSTKASTSHEEKQRKLFSDSCATWAKKKTSLQIGPEAWGESCFPNHVLHGK